MRKKIFEGFIGDAADAIKQMKETSKLSAQLVKDGEALGAKLAKAKSQDAALQLFKDHIKNAKKKIQSAKLDQDMKDSFETSFFDSFYGGLAKTFDVPVADVKKLLGETVQLTRIQELAGINAGLNLNEAEEGKKILAGIQKALGKLRDSDGKPFQFRIKLEPGAGDRTTIQINMFGKLKGVD
jgi:hypothetical protein